MRRLSPSPPPSLTSLTTPATFNSTHDPQPKTSTHRSSRTACHTKKTQPSIISAPFYLTETELKEKYRSIEEECSKTIETALKANKTPQKIYKDIYNNFYTFYSEEECLFYIEARKYFLLKDQLTCAIHAEKFIAEHGFSLPCIEERIEKTIVPHVGSVMLTANLSPKQAMTQFGLKSPKSESFLTDLEKRERIIPEAAKRISNFDAEYEDILQKTLLQLSPEANHLESPKHNYRQLLDNKIAEHIHGVMRQGTEDKDYFETRINRFWGDINAYHRSQGENARYHLTLDRILNQGETKLTAITFIQSSLHCDSLSFLSLSSLQSLDKEIMEAALNGIIKEEKTISEVIKRYYGWSLDKSSKMPKENQSVRNTLEKEIISRFVDTIIYQRIKIEEFISRYEIRLTQNINKLNESVFNGLFNLIKAYTEDFHKLIEQIDGYIIECGVTDTHHQECLQREAIYTYAIKLRKAKPRYDIARILAETEKKCAEYPLKIPDDLQAKLELEEKWDTQQSQSHPSQKIRLQKIILEEVAPEETTGIKKLATEIKEWFIDGWRTIISVFSS